MKSTVARIAKPFLLEVKRQLCWHRMGEYTFTVDSLGRYQFLCANRTEYSRTVDYGGEKTPLASFLFLLRPDDIVWDIGASVGLYTVHSAGIAERVVAFEPDPATFARLRQNVELNKMTDRVKLIPLALGAKKSHATLSTDGLDGFAPSIADLGRHDHSTRIEIDTIDNLIADGLPRPTVLKMDIEGAELIALEGATRFLHSRAKPRLLFIEVHPKFLPNYHSRYKSVEDVLRRSQYDIIGTRNRDEQYHLIAYR